MRAELNRLRSTFVPRLKRGDVLNLTPRLSLRALAFRVLSHAEIEHYLEDRVIEIALAADAAWKGRRHVSETTLCLLAFSGLSLDKTPPSLKPPPNKKQKNWDALIKPDDRLSTSISSYMRRVLHENHGIKEDNFISLLLPVGFDSNSIDDLLVAELNDFATKRGSAAHGSVAGHVTAGVNPIDEFAQVKRIVEGFKAVDEKLSVLLAAAR
jgi:hypothetical protein